MLDWSSIPDIPIPAIAALIAALAALVGYRTYHNKRIRDARDDIVKAKSLVSEVEELLTEKVRKAQRGLPDSGLTTQESESMTKTIDEALTLAPDLARVHQVAGAFHSAIGNIKKAEIHYRKAASLAPTDPYTHLALFTHLQRVASSSPDQHLKKALKAAVKTPESFASIGMALLVLDRVKEAESAYRAGLDVDSNISALWYNLGNLLRKQSRYEESFEAFQKAASINPNDPEIFCNYGNACDRIGKHEDALEHLRTAIRLDSNYALPHLNLAAVYQHLGMEEDAQNEYDRYLELNKN